MASHASFPQQEEYEVGSLDDGSKYVLLNRRSCSLDLLIKIMEKEFPRLRLNQISLNVDSSSGKVYLTQSENPHNIWMILSTDQERFRFTARSL